MQINQKGESFMRKKKINRIPDFKTRQEEAEFWDTHSFAECWDGLDDVDIVVDLHKPKEETLIVRLQKDVKDKLKKAARAKKLNVSTLARMWIMEKLRQSSRS